MARRTKAEKVKPGLNLLPEARQFVGARRLVTVDTDRAPIPASLAGCIVRVRAPAGEEGDSEFDHWLANVREVAERVIVLPAYAGKVVPDATRESAPKSEDARRVVLAMVDEANVEDRDALRVLVETTLAENWL